MRVIENKLNITAPIQTTFQWFKDLDDNYLQWHPKAHDNFAWLTDRPIGKGSKFFFEENINGHKHKMLMEVTEYIENKKLSFSSIRILVKSKLFPDRFMSFLSAFLKIRIEMKRTFKSISKNSTTIYTTHEFGCHMPLINQLVEWFIDSFILSCRYHENHMKEENEYMKSHLESS